MASFPAPGDLPYSDKLKNYIDEADAGSIPAAVTAAEEAAEAYLAGQLPELLGVTDSQAAALINTKGSQTEQALSATLATRIGTVKLTLSPTSAAANVATINGAVAAANAAYLAGSGITKIEMPEGNYPIRRSAGSGHPYAVLILPGVELSGQGEGKTVLTVEPFDLDHGFYETGYADTGFYQSIFYAKGTAESILRDVHLHDFTVDGNRANMLGVGPNANAGDTFDVSWADESVTLERLTVVNSSSDAFDYDDCKGMVVRFCTASNAAGFGYHNSENNDGVVQIGNIARGCGFGGNNRGGFDQYGTSVNGVYIGCVAIGNYRNFEVRGAGATVVGCHSGSIGAQPDVFEGAAIYMQPGANKGELGLFGAKGRLRFADANAPTDATRRWLQYVANNAMSWLRGSSVMFLVDLYANLGIGGMTSRGGTAEKALLIGDGVAPTSNPTGGVIAGSRSGTPYVRTTGGRLVTLAGNVTSTSAAYTVLPTDEVVLAVGGASGITVTLPALVNGMRFTIKKIDAGAGAVTVAGTGANIDGAGTKVLAAQYDRVTVVAATGSWHIV